MMRRDAAAIILERSVKWMPATRREWGEAMMAELEQVEGRKERFQFALGCLWVALFPPLERGRIIAMAHGPFGMYAARPRLAALAGVSLLIPFLAANAVVANRIEPLFSLIRPGMHTSPREVVLLAIVLLLMPVGAMVAMLPSVGRDGTGRRRLYVFNCAVAVALVAVFAVIASALGSEIYACEYLKVPNCD